MRAGYGRREAPAGVVADRVEVLTRTPPRKRLRRRPKSTTRYRPPKPAATAPRRDRPLADRPRSAPGAPGGESHRAADPDPDAGSRAGPRQASPAAARDHPRDQPARDRVHAGSGPGARADHVEPIDRGSVARPPRNGTEDQVLREVVASAHAVTAHQVRVVALQVVRAEDGPAEEALARAGRIPLELLKHPLRERPLCRLPVARLDRVAGVPVDPWRNHPDLDPEDVPAGGRPAPVDRRRLAPHPQPGP